MSKSLLFILAAFLSITLNAYSETIYFKDGRIIRGAVIERNNISILVKSGGSIPDKYYLNEIDRIETEEAKSENTLKIDTGKFPGIAAEKVKAIAHLLEINGTTRSLQKNIDEIIRKYPSDKTLELKRLLDINETVAILIPIYNRYFNDKEIADMTLFYESPTGKKVLEVSPNLMQEVMQTSIKYFQDKGQAFNSK